MGKDQLRSVWSLGLVGGLTIALAPSAVWAQLVPDGSLGLERSVIQKINELSDRIDGGAARGANLFHSFQEFNVGQGRSVYFANPVQIQNILSRVTGGNASNILGRLGVLGSANLFLINPNGIIFGPNSSLDIQGSFFATTADGIKLGDKGFFSATEPGKSDLLSVSPGALFLNQAASQAGNIINRGNLAVGGDLTLAAGNLDLQGQLLSGGNLTLQALDGVKIRDTVESPFVAAAVGDLLIQGNNIDIFTLNNPQSAIASYGNLTLKSPNPVIGDAHYWSGGNFRIETLDNNLGELQSIKDPVIRTGGDVFIGAYGGASLHIIAGGSVTIPGFILITGADPEFGLQENITLSNGQQINIDGKNNATLDIRAGVDEKFIGTPLIQESGNDFFVGRDLDSVSPTSADINIGAILFTTSLVDDTQNITGDVLLTNQYHPNLSLQGSINVKASLSPIFSEAIQTGSLNNGGRVTIDSRGNININGDINSTSLEKGGEIVLNSIGDIFITDSDINVRSSKDGNINVNASNVNILNSSIRSGINTDLGESDGQAGNIILDIKNNLTIDDSTISNFVRTNSQGNAGAIIIKTNSLDLKNGGNINASTLGTGDAGLISITAVENINLASDSYIASRVELTSIGNSGVININASNLTIEGRIESSVLGEGQLNAISLDVVESLTMNGGEIFNLVRGISPIIEENTNLAGINITTASLYLNNGSNINTSVTGQGNGGGVHITASDSISLSKSGIYNVLAEEAKGSTSNIEINTASLKIQNGSIINSTTLGSGDAGKINLDVLKDMVIENSNIISSAQSKVQGNSGGIEIKAGTLNINDGGNLAAQVSGTGDANKIKINVSDTFTLEGFLSGIYSVVLGNGSSGGIEIKAGTLNILDGAALDANVLGIGDSGTISIDVKDSMTLRGSNISSGVLAEAQGKSGGIEIKAGTLNILDGAGLDANISGIGDSGTISIDVKDSMTLRGSEISSTVLFEATGKSNTGEIDIKADNLNMIDSSIYANILGHGNSGIIDINISNTFNLQKSYISNTILGEGKSGGIKIDSGTLMIFNGSYLESSTFGASNAGQIIIDVSGNMTLQGEDSQGIRSRINNVIYGGATGKAEGIDIKAGTLNILDGARILSNVIGIGDAGKITIGVSDTITLKGTDSQGRVSNISSLVQEEAQGNSSKIEIKANTLNLLDGAELNNSTDGIGDAGGITIDVTDTITLQGENRRGLGSAVISRVNFDGLGNSGEIEIKARNLDLLDGARIDSSSRGIGNAGKIIFNIGDTMTLEGESSIGIGSSISNNSFGEGNSGGIEVKTGTLLLDKGQISNSIFGIGNADKIIIDVKGELTLQGESIFGTSGIFSRVDAGAEGDSEGIEVKAGTLNLFNGGSINATTDGIGDAGKVTINVSDTITLRGGDSLGAVSGVGSGVGLGAEGNSGGIEIKARNLQMFDGATITTNTQGIGNAGKIKIGVVETMTVGESQDVRTSVSSRVLLGGVGNSEGIEVNAGTLELLGGGRLNTTTEGLGKAGKIIVNVSGDLILKGQSNEGDGSSIASAVTPDGKKDSEGIDINATNVTLQDAAFITTSTGSNGNAGDIIITAKETFSASGARVFGDLVLGGVSAYTLGTGKAGNIVINSPVFNLSDGAEVSAFTQDAGNAGNITINSPQIVNIGQGSRIIAETRGAGKAGDITITTDTLNIGKDAELSATATQTATNPQGGGSITLNTSNLNISGKLGIFAETQGQSPAGNLTLQPNDNNPNLNIRFTDNGFISASTTATGNGGNIAISAPQTVDIRGKGKIAVETSGSGSAGTIDITTQNLTLADGLEISASTTGQGNAGNINLNTANLSLSQTQINAFTDSTGNAGSISISNQGNNANQVSLGDNSTLSTEIRANGQAQQPSNIDIRTNNLTLDNSRITASTQGKGDAGNITVPNTQQITLNQSEITASTSGEGDTGVIDLKATGNLNLTNSQISSSVEQGAVGNSRQITLDTPNLNLNNSQINATTAGQGNAGSIIAPNANTITLNNSTISTAIAPTGIATQPSNITLNTQQLTLDNNSRITASTQGKGNAGNITVPNAQTISLDNNSQINASTSGEGNAGDIALNAQTVTLNNSSAITTTVNPNAIGQGGNISLQTTGNSLTLNNQSQISSRSQGQGNAGNILINSAGYVTLTNSDISTSAEQASGGAITITARNLQFNGDSNLRTNVASGAGGGGNILLTADSILAFGDSDILAFARDGKGGNITFNTPIFFAEGFQPIPQDPNSLDGNNRVDINASGAVSGIITSPDLSFIRNSLIDLPENLIDIENLIANSCVVPNRQKAGTFVITGSGGLPTRPGDASMSSYSTGTVRAIPDKSASSQSWQPGNPIIEPQSVYRLSNGKLVLSRECP